MVRRSQRGLGRTQFCGVVGAGLLWTASAAWAGGTPENLLLIIDPSNSDALYVGNYYKNARDVPSRNVLYLAPGAANYAAFVDYNVDALFGALANAGIDDHIDYVVLTPGSPFYVWASGYVSDGCSPVTRFSISSVYTMAFIANEVRAGGLPSTNPNRYYSTSTSAYAFDSSTGWLAGVPDNSAYARRYFIGALLGYSGSYGNTLAQTIAMIDRSVAVDGTRPGGTFYFMNNTADPLRNVRSGQFAGAVSAIQALGGQAQIIDGVLPQGHHDCLGIMTGDDYLAIETTDMTILPGAFCDHMTSWAARFDNSAQTKVSPWINKGASGSYGTVEEPCNYTGKFPDARLHVFYFQGSSLGEAAFRSLGYTPFQGLLYGDPMTRPFAYLPSVTVDDAPPGPVSGAVVLTPAATTAKPGAAIAAFDLLIDGVLAGSVAPGGQFTVDTTLLADGWHDLRVLAYDNTLVKSTGRWIGSLTVSNHGRSVSLGVSPPSGNRTTPFVFNLAAAGGAASEVRVMQNGRIVAAGPGSSAMLMVYGLTLGAGPVSVQAEALFSDGRIVRSAPAAITVAPSADTPGGQPPVAYGFTKRVLKDHSFVVELPATFDNGAVPLTFEIIAAPTKTTVPGGQTGPYRLMRTLADAKGLDPFTFRVTSASGNSNVATVTLDYGVRRGDLNCDGDVNFADINVFVLALSDLTAWQAAHPDCPLENADCNRDGAVNFADINAFVSLLTEP